MKASEARKIAARAAKNIERTRAIAQIDTLTGAIRRQAKRGYNYLYFEEPLPSTRKWLGANGYSLKYDTDTISTPGWKITW